MGHWCEEFGTCQSRGGKGGKGYRSELHTWSSHRHPQDMQGLLGGGSRAPSLMPGQFVVGEAGATSAPPTLQALALAVLFFLPALHRASAVSMAIEDFLLVAFLCIMVRENLLKMQDFKGSLDFPAWKATSS